VPQGFELVCREARGAGGEDAWETDEKDHEFREIFKEEGQAAEEPSREDMGSDPQATAPYLSESLAREIDLRRRRGLAIF
jgi:hypothetical protein